ncbi:MAG: ATP-binding protein, partial [Myxococcota bacterium]|nr:ATP-binding protein [Myxococcota bacterium]
MEERRKSIRVNVSMTCNLKFGGVEYKGIINDLSISGARVTIDSQTARESLKENETGEVNFTTMWGMIEAEVLIQRVVRLHPFELGIVFVRMNEIASQVFQRMVGDLLRDNLVQSHKTQALSQLVSSMAHEVKGPIGVTVMAASHLQQLAEEIREKFKQQSLQPEMLESFLDSMDENTKIILNQGKRVNELADCFKTISLDQTTFERRVFVLPGYLHYVLLSLKTKLDKTGHELIVETPDTIEMEGYPGAFAQVISNLVENALLHAFDGDEGGTIKIRVIALNDDTIEVTLSDNGKGITTVDTNHIFGPFFTTENSERGTGMGLNIAGSLVIETMGGKI